MTSRQVDTSSKVPPALESQTTVASLTDLKKKKKKITLLLKGIFFLQQVLDQNFTDVKEAGFSLLCTHWSSLCFQMSSFGLPFKKKKTQKHVLAKKC